MNAQKTRTPPTWIAIALVVVAGVAVGAIFYSKLSAEMDSAPSEQIWNATSWRVQLFARKASGGVPELSWAELWQMARARGGFGLASFITKGQSLDGSVTNPYFTENDRRAGARIFTERCSVCHGRAGAGWHGPPLDRPGLKHGDSDLTLYKILRDGIPGTSMISAELGPAERWQVVAYIRALQMLGSGAEPNEAATLRVEVGSERLRAAGSRPDEWLTYSGSFDGRRYTPLNEITPANVAQLRARWIRQFDTNEQKIEATPLVVDGVLFTTHPPATVIALNAKTGEILWTYARTVAADLRLCCGRVNRGLAILGTSLFLGTLDGYLVAIDANTGSMLWQTKVADASAGYSMTGAPLVVNRSVIVGVAGSLFGIRGFLAAYDATTGRQDWKFHTIPGPGDPGSQTWKGTAWQTGGGPTWNTGSYDASLDLVYWGVGNPAPVFSGETRPGDNLYTNSVIALHARSGTLAWHFQFTPHDEHDWDATQTPILADVVIKGSQRKVICWANRNGFYYVLDRVTGEFLTGTPFVEQNWAEGLDAAGRPILQEAGEVTKAGRLVKPGVAGGTNWQNAAFDARQELIFVHATEGASVFTKSANPERVDRGTFLGSAGSMVSSGYSVVRALDATTGARRWEHAGPRSNNFPIYSGLLATGGGLVFGASEGHVFALDSTTGQALWRVPLGGNTLAAPISFTMDGRQVIAVSAGRALFVFGL